MRHKEYTTTMHEMHSHETRTVAEAVDRLIAISELAHGLLVCHGAFGMPWPDYDGLGSRLVKALEDRNLPHDWEVARAFVARGDS